MRISVIGTGYVGLVAGACFAETGNVVTCIDKDPGKIESLLQGKIPIFEPGLEELVARGIRNKTLCFATSMEESVRQSEIVFLAVGTPSLPSGEPDLQYLEAAVSEMKQSLRPGTIVVNKSTVPIGAHRTVAEWLRRSSSESVEVVSNPEFLKEGSAVEDFLKPDRIVIGTLSERAYLKMKELYSPLLSPEVPLLWMDPVSAEMTKYACNSFLATRISFMNELAALCDKVGADIEEVRKGMTADVRIGKHFLFPGVGYGGSCFPKDIQALLNTAKKESIPLEIIASTDRANSRQKAYLIEQIKNYLGSDLRNRVFAVWGLAFKPNTDDMREAPSLAVIHGLLEAGAQVQAYDPVAIENAKKLLPSQVIFSSSRYHAVEGADALLLLTEWDEFRSPNFNRLTSLMNPKLQEKFVFDGRNLFDPNDVDQSGLTYIGVGRKSSQKIPFTRST